MFLGCKIEKRIHKQTFELDVVIKKLFLRSYSPI